MLYNCVVPDFMWLPPSLWLSLLLFDLDYVTPNKWNLWCFFGRYCYACFVLMYIVTAFPYLIKTEWILCLISTACWLKRHEIYVYCYSCNIYFVFNDINYSYVVANLIWYGYYCCCSILTMSHPANEIYGGFWLILLCMFRFDVYRNNLPVFDQNRMNLVLNLHSLLIETTWNLCILLQL